MTSLPMPLYAEANILVGVDGTYKASIIVEFPKHLAAGDPNWILEQQGRTQEEAIRNLYYHLQELADLWAKRHWAEKR